MFGSRESTLISQAIPRQTPGFLALSVRSGIAAARNRGVVFGRRPGQRIKADRYAPKVLKLVDEGQSYREISHRLGLSKNTVLDIVKRNRATQLSSNP